MNSSLIQRGCGFDGICSMIEKLLCPVNNGTCNCKFCTTDYCNDDSSSARSQFISFEYRFIQKIEFLFTFFALLILSY